MTTPDPIDQHFEAVAPLFANMADEALRRIVRNIAVVHYSEPHPVIRRTVNELARIYNIDPRAFQ